MSTIDELVSVSISTSSTVVPLPAFNVPMFVGTTGFTTGTTSDLSRTYGSLSAVKADFATSTPEYQAALAAFSLSNPPASIVIGQAPTPVAGVQTLTFSAATVTGNVINGNVDGTAIGPITWATSDAATLSAVANAIAAVQGIASATVAGEVITVTAMTGWALTLSNFVVAGGATQPTVAVATTTPQKIWSDAIAKIRAANKGWYGFSISDQTQGAILDVASWAEANPVLFFPTTGDTAAVGTGTTDVASELKAKNYERTIPSYHSVSTELLGFEACCELLSYTPGAASLMYKVFPGITAEDKTTAGLTETQATNARGNYTVGNQGKNLNIYSNLSGVTFYEPGIASGGQFADITIGLDWLKATLQADILSLQTSTPKVPYTDAGVAMFESKLRTRIKLAQDAGIVATSPAPTYTVPKVADQSSQQRAARIFPSITVKGNLQGAINAVGFALTLMP